eukprot:scpid94424/ scgid2802/ 
MEQACLYSFTPLCRFPVDCVSPAIARCCHQQQQAAGVGGEVKEFALARLRRLGGGDVRAAGPVGWGSAGALLPIPGTLSCPRHHSHHHRVVHVCVRVYFAPAVSNHSCIIRTDSQNSYVSGQQASLFGGSTAPPCSVTSDRPSGLVLPGIGAHRTPGARSGSDQTYCTIEEPSSCLDNAPGNTYQDSPNPPSSSSHTRSSPWHGAVSGRHHLKDSIRRRIASIGRALELRRHATETPPMLTSNSGG